MIKRDPTNPLYTQLPSIDEALESWSPEELASIEGLIPRGGGYASPMPDDERRWRIAELLIGMRGRSTDDT